MSGTDPAKAARAWIRALKDDGAQAYGVWCSLPSSYATELVASAHPDFVVLDRQHGFFDHRDLVAALQSLNGTPVRALVRVAANRPELIGAALDAGASGVIVPLIEDGADAIAAVRASRYVPEGRRSYGPGRSAFVVPGDPAAVNAAVAVVALVESAAGAERAEEIAATPGLDAMMVGVADLAVDLGLQVGGRSPRLDSLIARVVDAAAAHDVPVMVAASARSASAAATLLVVATDSMALRSGIEAALRDGRAADQI